MVDKLMYIPKSNELHKITHSESYNKWLKRFYTQLNELNSMKVHKVVLPTNKKTLLLEEDWFIIHCLVPYFPEY